MPDSNHSSPSQLGIAVVGSGSIAKTHAAALKQLPQVRFVGVVGRNPETTGKLASEHSTRAFATVEEVLKEPGLDALLIATPSGAHLDPALAAFRAGKHVLCEKPLEINLERTLTMIQAAKEHGCVLGGFFPMRTGKGASTIRKAIDSARFGRLTFISARVKWWRDPSYYRDSTWRGTQRLDGGGALINQGIHAVDLFQWFGGKVRSVSARKATLAHDGIEVEDTLAAVVDFESGALGTIEASTAAYPGLELSLEVSGSRGTAVMENDRITHWQFDEEQDGDEAIRQAGKSHLSSGANSHVVASCEGHRQQIEHFCRAIQGDASGMIQGLEASYAVGIVEACYRAARQGECISVDYLA